VLKVGLSEEQLLNAERTQEIFPVRYPGEGMLSVRKKSMEKGSSPMKGYGMK